MCLSCFHKTISIKIWLIFVRLPGERIHVRCTLDLVGGDPRIDHGCGDSIVWRMCCGVAKGSDDVIGAGCDFFGALAR